MEKMFNIQLTEKEFVLLIGMVSNLNIARQGYPQSFDFWLNTLDNEEWNHFINIILEVARQHN